MNVHIRFDIWRLRLNNITAKTSELKRRLPAHTHIRESFPNLDAKHTHHTYFPLRTSEVFDLLQVLVRLNKDETHLMTRKVNERFLLSCGCGFITRNYHELCIGN